MNIQTEAIVIRSTKYSESDLILNLFTRKLGKIGVYAKNARRIKSHLLSSTQIFSYSNMTISTFDGRYKLLNAELIDNNFLLSASFEKMNLAYYFIQFVDRVTMEGQTNIRLFELLKNSLANLKEYSNILLQKIIFDIQIISVLGLFPILDSCIECQKKENLGNLFSVDYGGRICKECFEPENKNIVKLDSTTFRFLEFILKNKFEKIMLAKVDESILKETNYVLDLFIDFHFNDLNLSTRDLLIY